VSDDGVCVVVGIDDVVDYEDRRGLGSGGSAKSGDERSDAAWTSWD
jgi:hypothetical protein